MTHAVPPALRAGHPLLGLGYAEPVAPRAYLRLDGDHVVRGESAVAEEVPVAFVYNGRPHVVMMATPRDLEDFAVGFTLTEEIVAAPSAIGHVAVIPYSQGIEMQLEVPAREAQALAERGRQLAGRTGCGLCGVETIAQALREPRAVAPHAPVPVASLWRAEGELGTRQPYNRDTGAMHAAAWADAGGVLRVVREDVGRHNALDKVIGALARQGVDPAGGFVVMTSRASYELVQKCAVAGIPLLAAISRPTGLAIRLAEAAGITLVGLLRDRTANVYAHPGGLRAGEGPLSDI